MIDAKKFNQEIVARGFSSFRDGRLAQVQNAFEVGSAEIPDDFDPNLLSRAHNERFLRVTAGRPCVYFVQAGLSGPVKIGIATELRPRLYDLQCSNHEALFVIAVILDAGRDEEQALHARFRGDWLRGEWFRRSDALLAYMKTLPEAP